MNIQSFRKILRSAKGPYVVSTSNGETIAIEHIDFVALPGPSAGAEHLEPLVAIYCRGRIDFLDLSQVVKVSIPSEVTT